VQFTRLAHRRERLLLNRRRAQLDALKHGWVQDVQPSVDAVADELDGLFDEAVDAGFVAGLVDDDTVFGRFFDFGDDDGAFVAVGFVEGEQLLEGVVADDVGVEDEEGGVVFAEDLLGELEGAGGAEGFGLDGEGDFDVEFGFVLLGREVC